MRRGTRVLTVVTCYSPPSTPPIPSASCTRRKSMARLKRQIPSPPCDAYASMEEDEVSEPHSASPVSSPTLSLVLDGHSHDSGAAPTSSTSSYASHSPEPSSPTTANSPRNTPASSTSEDASSGSSSLSSPSSIHRQLHSLRLLAPAPRPQRRSPRLRAAHVMSTSAPRGGRGRGRGMPRGGSARAGLSRGGSASHPSPPPAVPAAAAAGSARPPTGALLRPAVTRPPPPAPHAQQEEGDWDTRRINAWSQPHSPQVRAEPALVPAPRVRFEQDHRDLFTESDSLPHKPHPAVRLYPTRADPSPFSARLSLSPVASRSSQPSTLCCQASPFLSRS